MAATASADPLPELPDLPGTRVRFGIAYPGRLAVVHWEVDSVLFNGGTGETHLLGPIPVEIVSLLQAEAMSLSRLCTTMAERCHVENDSRWRDKLSGVLRDLEALEIIEVAIDEP